MKTDTEAMNKHIITLFCRELKHLLQKYESIQKNTIIMDDYDGGKIDMAEKIVTDLKALLAAFEEEKNEKIS